MAIAGRPWGTGGWGAGGYATMANVQTAAAAGSLQLAGHALAYRVQRVGANGSLVLGGGASLVRVQADAFARGGFTLAGYATLLKTWDTALTPPCEAGGWPLAVTLVGDWTPADDCSPGDWSNAA